MLSCCCLPVAFGGSQGYVAAQREECVGDCGGGEWGKALGSSAKELQVGWGVGGWDSLNPQRCITGRVQDKSAWVVQLSWALQSPVA